MGTRINGCAGRAIDPTFDPPRLGDSSQEVGSLVAEARRQAEPGESVTVLDPLLSDGLFRGSSISVGIGKNSVVVALPQRPVRPQSEIPSGGTSIVLAGSQREMSANLVIAERGRGLTYRFLFSLPEGFTLYPGGAGQVLIGKEFNGGMLIAGRVDSPWALDASGTRVPTSYTISGSALIQTVDTSKAQLPVVADPRISFGWHVYARYSRSEIQRFWSGSVIANKVAFAIACSYIPTPNQCVELKLQLVTYLPVGWKRYSC